MKAPHHRSESGHVISNHHLEGKVTRYKGNGRALGYPTANIATPTTVKDGVYFGIADLNSYYRHPAIIFVGTPTTMGDTTRRVEAHLLDVPDKDYYGFKLVLDILHFHRSNHTFASVDDLLVAMQADEDAARMWFGRELAVS